MPWCRRGRGFVCTPSPRLLCSREFWREFRDEVRLLLVATGGGWGETPYMIVKRFGCIAIHNKALYKCIIHSFIHSFILVSSPVLAGPSMVCGPGSPSRRLSMGDSRSAGSPLTGRGHHSSPPPRVVEAMGVAPEGAQLIASGLSTEVVETILQSRAPSTRKSYTAKWHLFTSWCHSRQLDPVVCPLGSMLEFMQDRFASGLSSSTLSVYVAAIAAHHAPVGEQSLGRNPLVTRFLRGTRRLRPPVRPRMPTWDLAVVLEALSKAPFEPLEDVPWRFLTVKTVFLLAIWRESVICRPCQWPHHVSSLRLVWREHFCTPGRGMSLRCPQLFHGQLFFRRSVHLPFGILTRKSLIVRALDTYVHRAALWRKSDHLFVCYGPYKKGLPANKQTLSRWIVDAITTAYEFSDLPSPLGARAHSTRGMAASKAFSSGVSMHDICNAAGWSTPRYYSLDLDATPGSSVLSA